MVSWWMKNSLQSIDIRDIVTNMVRIQYTKHHQMNIILLRKHLYFANWVCSSMLYNLEMSTLDAVQAISKINNML